jgi:hypothetical protein
MNTMIRNYTGTRANHHWSTARFVAQAKANSPDAWKSVDCVKMACALEAAFPEWLAAFWASQRERCTDALRQPQEGRRSSIEADSKTPEIEHFARAA